MTQHILTEVLGDEKWLADYVRVNQQRIKECYDALKDALAVVDCVLYPSDGTLMAWADFRAILPENPTWEDEANLCIRLSEECSWFVTPGKTCISDKPGFYRLVFTESGLDALYELKQRLIKFKANQAIQK